MSVCQSSSADTTSSNPHSIIVHAFDRIFSNLLEDRLPLLFILHRIEVITSLNVQECIALPPCVLFTFLDTVELLFIIERIDNKVIARLWTWCHFHGFLATFVDPTATL